MDLHEFTENAVKTESRIDMVRCNVSILSDALRAFIASAEILDKIKKNVFYGKPIHWFEMQIDAEKIYANGKHIRDGLEYDRFSNEISEINPRIFHALIGICTEAGEIAEALGDGMIGSLDTVNMLEEFGDVDWYKAIAFDELNVDPHLPLIAVIEKLQKRYPDKFTSDAAINRDVDSERELLESKLE